MFIAGSDQIAIQRAIEKYEDIDLQFAGSREGNLLRVRIGKTRLAPPPCSAVPACVSWCMPEWRPPVRIMRPHAGACCS